MELPLHPPDDDHDKLYVQQLEFRVKALESANACLDERVLNLELDLFHADELRAGIVRCAASAAQTTVEALKRLELYQPLVDAACAYTVWGTMNNYKTLIACAQRELTRREGVV